VESSVAKSGAKTLLKGGAKALLRGSGVGTVITVGMEGYENFAGEKASKRSTKAKVARTGIGAAGALGGAAAGAAIGSVVPVVGTLVGGIVGGIAGSMLADKANEKLISDESEGNQSEEEKKRRKQEKYSQEQAHKLQKQQQKEAMIARAVAEKQAYDQLDDLGKLRKTQEDMYKLQDKWFQFDVESQVRSILDNPDLDNNKKMRRLKGISTGAAGMQRMTQAVDASGMTTLRIIGAKNIADQKIYSQSDWQN
jgi:phage tail tape-measure protein